jgi:hypothetical protein
MAAIGLLDIPSEIQLQIVEFAETSQTLKALSVTSRSFRSIAQSMLFENLQIDVGSELRGSIDDLVANSRICAAIRTLQLRGRYLFGETPPRNDEEQLSLIKKILPEMVGLRKVSINQVNLSQAFLDAFLEIAASTPLHITLSWNIYPCSAIPTPPTPLQIPLLQISHFHFTAPFDRPSLKFYRAMCHACATTLTGLSMRIDGNLIMELAEVSLPFLQDLTLLITLENEVSRTNAAAFLAVHRTVRKLDLRGKFFLIPPNALPNLRELKSSAELVNQLVPRRPVEVIEVTIPHWGDQYWLGEEVGQSTARVRNLRVYSNGILDTRLVKRLVKTLPSLESLFLPVFDSVSGLSLDYLGGSFPSGIPQCRRSSHFTQMPQEPILQTASSRSLGKSQRQRHRYQTARCKFILHTPRDLGI